MTANTLLPSVAFGASARPGRPELSVTDDASGEQGGGGVGRAVGGAEGECVALAVDDVDASGDEGKAGGDGRVAQADVERAPAVMAGVLDDQGKAGGLAGTDVRERVGDGACDESGGGQRSRERCAADRPADAAERDRALRGRERPAVGADEDAVRVGGRNDRLLDLDAWRRQIESRRCRC